MTLNGSCLCGKIRYRITGPLHSVLNCHCSMCRKAHGAAFRTRAAVKTAEFEWLDGEALLTRYESSPGEHRSFCSRCGSNVVSALLGNVLDLLQKVTNQGQKIFFVHLLTLNCYLCRKKSFFD